MAAITGKLMADFAMIFAEILYAERGIGTDS